MKKNTNNTWKTNVCTLFAFQQDNILCSAVVNVFTVEIANYIGDTIFYVSYWRQDHHLRGHPNHAKSSRSQRKETLKGSPFIRLSYFSTLSIGLAKGIELSISRPV